MKPDSLKQDYVPESHESNTIRWRFESQNGIRRVLTGHAQIPYVSH